MAKKLLALLLLQAVKAQDCSGQGTTWGVGIAPPPEGCGPGSGDGSCNNPSCSSPPCAAPLLGDVGCSTVAGVEDSFNHQEVMKGDSIPTAAHIFGPFEDGFSERQQKTIELWGCSDPTVVYDDGGKDITVTEAAIAKACNIQFPRIEGENYIGIVGPCGGHTKEYHFHRGLGCLYQVVADSYLVPALISIGRGLQMSDALLGATLLALGGSANDFMTGFVSALTHNGDAGATENDIKLWLGGVFGTGVFINTFVASLVLLFAGPEGIKVDPVVLTRDIGFRFLAVGLMMLFGVLGFVSTYMALFMNFLYVVYVLISLRESRAQRIEAPTAEPGSSFLLASFASRGSRVSACSGALAGHLSEPSAEQSETCRSRLKRHAGWEDEQSCLERLSFVLSLPLRPFFALTMATDTWDPVVNVLLPFGMCIFIPFGNPFGNVYSDASEALSSKELGSGWTLCATLGIFWLLGLALSFAAFAVARRRPGVYLAKTSFNWATFLTSLLWVALFANEVVGAMQLLGTIMGLKPMVMGITLLAWGNCVDNVFAMLGLAKAGEFRVAITGIYAGPMFNVLFGNGCILLMSAVLNHGQTPFIMSPAAFVLLGVMEVVLVGTLLYTKLCAWHMTKTLGLILCIAYPVTLAAGFIVEHLMGADG